MLRIAISFSRRSALSSPSKDDAQAERDLQRDPLRVAAKHCGFPLKTAGAQGVPVVKIGRRSNGNRRDIPNGI